MHTSELPLFTFFSGFRVWTALFGALIFGYPQVFSQEIATKGKLIIEYSQGHPANTINPNKALGAGIDGHEFGDNSVMLSPENIRTMKSTGLKSLTYRLRTELGQEAWHWNPDGQWSDPQKKQGYWVSDSRPKKFIRNSYGYHLPRRGSTFDQADNTGYSRIDDGEDSTFWKSNPYLDHRFTGVDDSLHPQWIAVDLGKQVLVNTLKIHWADPFALNFKLEYADSSESDFSKSMKILSPYRAGFWKPLPEGTYTNCKGGLITLEFPGPPRSMRLIRILCTKSSGTALQGSADPRDSAGYAIREIELGLTLKGRFTDYIQHSKSNKTQSAIFVSTTDPWHRDLDKDLDTEQPGLDFIFETQLNQGLPVLYALPMVYDNPENALAQVLYMERRHYPIQEWELGEEPDGQYISAKDFAFLYSQLAGSIHRLGKHYKVGGPSFQSLDEPIDEGDQFMQKTWMEEFIRALQEQGKLSLFEFFSFEWYPFDNICGPQSSLLVSESLRLEKAYTSIKQVLPPSLPIYISEYGYSVAAAEPEVRMEGALLNADLMGQFLTLGGKKAYLYGYEPGTLMNETGCSWGNLMLFGLNKKGKIEYSTALYQAAKLYAQNWADPENKYFEVYPCKILMADTLIKGLVNAYALHNPKGKWSLLIINKDSSRSFQMEVRINNKKKNRQSTWTGYRTLYQYSPKQYIWESKGPNGRPLINNKPQMEKIQLREDLVLPPYSISVIKD